MRSEGSASKSQRDFRLVMFQGSLPMLAVAGQLNVGVGDVENAETENRKSRVQNNLSQTAVAKSNVAVSWHH